MKLVVDASVAVKWFVKEEGHEEALAILDRGDECIAPDIFVPEVAGVLLKKLRIGDLIPGQVTEGISAAVSNVTLIECKKLVQSALEIAVELSHSVYDCLYLACAMHSGAVMVTADAKFETVAQKFGYGGFVKIIGQETRSTKMPLSINQVDLEELIKLHDNLERTFKSVIEQIKSDAQARLSIVHSSDLKPAFDSPNYLRLKRYLEALRKEQLYDIEALCWFGRNGNQSYTELREHAVSLASDPMDFRYIMSKLGTLQSGLMRLKLEAENLVSE